MSVRIKKTWYWVIIACVLALLGVVLVILAISVIGALSDADKMKIGQTDPNTSAAQLVTKAVQQQQSNDLEGAERSLEAALAKDAKLDYTSQLALVRYRMKKYSESIDAYQQVIDGNGEKAFAWNGMGNAYRDWAEDDSAQRDYLQNQAVSAYKKALEADAGYVAAYSNQAQLLVDMDKPDEALIIAQTGAEKTGRQELKDLASRLKLQ